MADTPNLGLKHYPLGGATHPELYWNDNMDAIDEAFDPLLSAWTAFTPGVVAAIGSLTTASATGKYVQIGKTVHFWITITVTTNGTGAGAIDVGLPVTASGTNRVSGCGYRADSGGWALSITQLSTTGLRVYKYDAVTYPAGDGAVLVINGTYEAA
jgi:hypothetical protein